MGRSFFASWNVLFSREGEREVLQSPICNYVSLGTYCVLLVSGGLVTVRGSWVFFFFFPAVSWGFVGAMLRSMEARKWSLIGTNPN